MKKILAIATLLLATGSTQLVQAASFPSTTSQNARTIQSEGILVADRLDEEFEDYRRQRHVQLERQMRQELSQPKYRYMSQQEKERSIRQAHDNLDDALDRQEKSWRREQERRQDRYDRYDDRYDRYNRYDDRYDRYDRYDNRYDPQNPYGQRNRLERSRYNNRYYSR